MFVNTTISPGDKVKTKKYLHRTMKISLNPDMIENYSNIILTVDYMLEDGIFKVKENQWTWDIGMMSKYMKKEDIC